MLHRVKRGELTFSHLLAHPLCNTPQHTLLVLLLLLNTSAQLLQFTPVPCFSPAIFLATNAIIKSCRTLLPAPTPSQQSHQWPCKHLLNPGFPFIHMQLLPSVRTSQAAVQGMESTYSPRVWSAVYKLYRERKASNNFSSWHLLGGFLVEKNPGWFQVLCCNLLKVNNSIVYWGGKERTGCVVCGLQCKIEGLQLLSLQIPFVCEQSPDILSFGAAVVVMLCHGALSLLGSCLSPSSGFVDEQQG